MKDSRLGNDEPKVSIIISSFNRVNELKETVKRTLETNYFNYELIIVDSSSTDGSREYIESLDQNKIKIIFIPNNGSAYAHNKGMEAASGKYIILIDDDCYLHPDVIYHTVKIFEKNSKLAAIGYGLVNPNSTNTINLYKNNLEKINEKNFDNSYEVIVLSSAAGLRNSAVKKVNYMEYLMNWSTRGEDKELMVNLIKHEYNTCIIPELLAFHKVAPSHRPPMQLTYNGINSVIFILFKHFPLILIFKNITKLFYLSIYNLFFQNRFHIYMVSLED